MCVVVTGSRSNTGTVYASRVENEASPLRDRVHRWTMRDAFTFEGRAQGQQCRARQTDRDKTETETETETGARERRGLHRRCSGRLGRERENETERDRERQEREREGGRERG